MFTVLLFAMLFASSAKAADYISDVMLIGHDNNSSAESLVSSYESQGWTRISRDLNDGAGGDYIYLLYKKESTAGQNYDFITDFYIKTGSSAPDELTYNGRTYHLVPYDGRQHFKNQKGDLNSGTGENTPSIHLYYTRDYFSNNQVVNNIEFSITKKSGALGANGGSEGYDLNDGAGGRYIYMHVSYGTAKPELLGDGTSDNAYQINNDKDWNLFIKNVNDGKSEGKYFYQSRDIAVKDPVGTSENPFAGYYFGNGHKLDLTIISNQDFPAPFRYIRNAAIKDVRTDGLVTYVGSGNGHCGGLVGAVYEVGYITGCTVSGKVLSYNKYCGGVVGHASTSTLIIENTVFDGTAGSFAQYAGGLVGWCDGATLDIHNCLVTGTFDYIEPGKFHPIACTYEGTGATATSSEVFYLNTIGKKYDQWNVVPGAEGQPVSATPTENEWDEPLVAIDGKTYYGAHISGGRPLPYSFGFEQMPCGWSVYDTCDQSGLTTEDARRGVSSFKFAESSQDQYLITPELKGYEHQGISFRFRGANNDDIRLQVGVSTTTNELSSFSWSSEFVTKSSGWSLASIESKGRIKYVAIKCLANGAPLFLDDFFIEEKGIYTPVDLAVNDITTSSAKLQWDGNADAYTVRYRAQASFTEDFENVKGWGTHREGGNQNTAWGIVNLGNQSHSGNKVAMSTSIDMTTGDGNVDEMTTYSVDNWLVTPQIVLGKTLTYWLYPSHDAFAYHEIMVSTTDLKGSSFYTIATPTLDHPELAQSTQWEQVTVDLGDLAGQTGYIAFRMKDEGKKMMIIDDVAVNNDEWNTTTTSDCSVVIIGLAAGLTYDVQVQGSKGDATTGWSQAITFTTLPSEDHPDGISVLTTKSLPLQATWFDLMGRRLNTTPSKPGLYINNGKKMIRK